MSLERAKAHLKACGLQDRIMEFEVSSATVELAAQAVGCAPAHIAKTLSFLDAREGWTVLVVAAGDAKIDNQKYKAFFGCKAKMLCAQEVEARVGHGVGGVCPFGVNEHVRVYTDRSLQRFDTVYPAAGTASSAVRLSCQELFEAAASQGWIDVCKGWEQA